MRENESENSNSVVEINFGQHRVRVESSEEFISEQLESILSWTTESIEKVEAGSEIESPEPEEEELTQELLADVRDNTNEVGHKPGSGESERDKAPVNTKHTGGEQLGKIAKQLNIDPSALSDHFYLDGEGTHIRDPLDIDPKFAFLGYCLIEKERTGESYRENRATKQALIDREMIDIDSWGSNFLYRLRQEGLIKDNPNSDRKRNRPFKITPKGHREFVNWIEN